MAREWRRLLVAPGRLAAAVPLEPPEERYLRRVLRLRPGERFALVDGAGHLWSASLEAGAAGEPARARLEQPPERPLLAEPPPAPSLQLAVALPRQDADVLLRMACELGIDHLSPLRAGRSAAGEPLKTQRQVAILREATEQCERLWLPRLDPPRPAEAFLAVRSPAAGEAERPALRLLATTRRSGLPPLEQRLAAAAGSAPPDALTAGSLMAGSLTVGSVAVAIGPEGGWTPAEERAAEAAGWDPVDLGATILRTSTAAVGAAALLAAWRRGLSCGTSRPPSP